jgi:hypothetical protein
LIKFIITAISAKEVEIFLKEKEKVSERGESLKRKLASELENSSLIFFLY